MASCAMARARICALRREIAKIEGTLPEHLEAPESRRPHEEADRNGAGGILVRRQGRIVAGEELDPTLVATGAQAFDDALGGGLPRAALTEIISTETRNAGAAAGFALAFAALAARSESAEAENAGAELPVLWIGLRNVFREAGFPHAPGAGHFFGLTPERLFFSEVAKLEDALWIAEEAARLGRCAAVLVEVLGNPARLDLTATRRLHRRARLSGRPVFMIREAARAEPTAAPFRLEIAPAASALRQTLAGAMPQSIGPPAFSVSLSKSRTGFARTFILEWNAHDRAFQEKHPEDPGALVPASSDRPADTAAVRQVLARDPAERHAG